MSVSRHRIARFLADSLPIWEPDCPSRSTFYREEFVKCQRCLEQQREYYSERAVHDVEEALGKVMPAARSSVRRRRRRPGRQPAAAPVRRRDRRLRPGPTPGKSTDRLFALLRHNSTAHLARGPGRRGCWRARDPRGRVSRPLPQALSSAAAVDVVAAGKAAGAMLDAFAAASPRRARTMLGIGPGDSPRPARCGVARGRASRPDRRQRRGRAPRPGGGQPRDGREICCWCCCPVAGRR